MTSEMQRALLKCRYIRDEKNNYSFQLVNAETGNVVLGFQAWFPNKEAAVQGWHNECDRLLENITAKGGKLVYRDDDNLIFETEVAAAAPPSVRVLVGLVGNDNGKFGIAVFADTEMVISPNVWFDSVEEAYTHYHSNIPAYTKQMHEAGYTDVVLGVQPLNKLAPALRPIKNPQQPLAGTENIPTDFDATSN